jgi:NTE family protein
MRFAAVLLVAAASCLCGCATAIFNKASNVPWARGTTPDMDLPADTMGENSIVVTFSGGGLRAAAFAHGVLTALESEKTPEGDLLDDVAIVSSVSGSSLTSAYYGLYGRDGLRRFREEVLLPGFESGLRLSLLNPANLVRIMHGGLNAREDFGDVLDRDVFHGAKFADLFRRPRPSIRIHATDLYHRVPFPVPRRSSPSCAAIFHATAWPTPSRRRWRCRSSSRRS